MPEPKEVEIKTPIAPVQLEEKKPETGDDTPKTEVPEEVKKVEIEESELAKLKKKAEDFDGIVEKNRIAKLDKKENKPVAADDVQNKIAELKAEVESFKAEKANDNLVEAYREFTKEFPWAKSDEYFNKIVEKFDSEGATSKDGLNAKLKAITISLFPNEYAQHIEKEVKQKALVEATKINIGGGNGSGADNPNAKDSGKVDPLAKLKERFASTLPKGYTVIKK